MEKLMLKLSEFCDCCHLSGVKILAKYIRRGIPIVHSLKTIFEKETLEMKYFKNRIINLYWQLGIPVILEKISQRFENNSAFKKIAEISKRFSKLEKILYAIVLFGALIVYAYLFSKPEDPQVTLWKELVTVTEDVCKNGVGYAGAPEYPSSKDNSIVIGPYTRVEPLSHKYEIIRDANQYLPDEIKPIPGQLPTLIACLSAETKKIQVVEYINGPDITRYRTDKFLTIRSVRTGEIIHEETFMGDNPRAAKKSESSNTNRLYGSSISDEALSNWIMDWLP